jgi:hypothetical protein
MLLPHPTPGFLFFLASLFRPTYGGMEPDEE